MRKFISLNTTKQFQNREEFLAFVYENGYDVTLHDIAVTQIGKRDIVHGSEQLACESYRLSDAKGTINVSSDFAEGTRPEVIIYKYECVVLLSNNSSCPFTWEQYECAKSAMNKKTSGKTTKS